jgi:hypothetical protein
MRLRLDVFSHHTTTVYVIGLFFVFIVENPDPTSGVQFVQHAFIIRKVVAVIFSGRERRNAECGIATSSVKTRVKCQVHFNILFFYFFIPF